MLLVFRRTKGILVFSPNEFPLCYSLSLPGARFFLIIDNVRTGDLSN